MKVSFKALPVKATLNGQETIEDLSQIVAEAVYQNAANFEQHKLAHRIAETDGEVDLNAVEAEAVKMAVSNYKFFVQKPILEALGEKFD